MNTPTLDLSKPLYFIATDATRYYGDIEYSVIGSYNMLTNDPNYLDGCFEFDAGLWASYERWDGAEEITDQKSYDAWLNSIHVTPATGKVCVANDGSWWYDAGNNDWYELWNDGELHAVSDADVPEELWKE